ncbi:MAG: isochorismate synthase [Deltaproteobacteria bacterium]|nr:isochorismate synthase [Deltaproteobacteria bacterium]
MPKPLDPPLSLDALCQEAVNKAARTGQPVLVCHALPWAGGDPLAVLEASSGPEPFRFYWERPKDGFALAAGGEAMGFSAGGADRFAVLAAQMEQVLGEAVGSQPAGGVSGLEGPFGVGGFSFFPDVDRDQWPGYDPARMVVPRWAVCRQGNQAMAMVCQSARPGDDPAGLADQARQAVGGLGRTLAASAISGPDRTETAPMATRRLDDLEGHRHWLEMVRAALTRIKSGELEKVVLARTVELTSHGDFSPFAVLRELRSAYPNCFTFFVDPGGGAQFLGASPERLARFTPEDGGGVTIRLGALAGTAPRGEEPDADALLGSRLLASGKEIHEHRIVVDAILRAVEPLGCRVETPSSPRLIKLNNVQHLYTPITLRADSPVSILDVVARLHPTPAVGGVPAGKAGGFILAHERFDRGWYASPIGWINGGGRGEFAVALRAGIIRSGGVRLFTGAGIVADSDPEGEYFETQLKLQPLLGAFHHD